MKINFTNCVKKFRYRTEWYFKNKEILDIWNNYKLLPKEEKQIEPITNIENIKSSKNAVIVFNHLEDYYKIKRYSVDILQFILKHLEFNNPFLLLTEDLKLKMKQDLNINDHYIDKYLKALNETSLIYINKNEICVNPLTFWKGDLKQREKILSEPKMMFMFNYEIRTTKIVPLSYI